MKTYAAILALATMACTTAEDTWVGGDGISWVGKDPRDRSLVALTRPTKRVSSGCFRRPYAIPASMAALFHLEAIGLCLVEILPACAENGRER